MGRNKAGHQGLALQVYHLRVIGLQWQYFGIATYGQNQSVLDRKGRCNLILAVNGEYRPAIEDGIGSLRRTGPQQYTQ